MANQTVSERLAAWTTSLKWSDVPQRVQNRARDRFLDAVSTAIAGRDVASSTVARKALTAAGPCTSLVDDTLRPAEDAALVNGVSVHSILYEDIHAASSDHPGPVLIPSIFAAAEDRIANGAAVTLEDLWSAILVGYEIQIALGKVMAGNAIGQGFRTTSLFGSVAAAAAVARLWRLDAGATEAAINLGANFAFGFLEGWALSTMEPYIHGGMAGRNGITAARLGASGAVTSKITFEGPNGYFRAFGSENAGESFQIGTDWWIMDIWTKAYPLSAGKQRATDAALDAVQHGVRPEDIDRVVVKMSPGTIAYPGADKSGHFDTFTQAQNSTQFCVAAALLDRDMTLVSTFTEGYTDPEICAFTKKISLLGEEERRATKAERLEIHLKNGSVSSHEVEWAEGRNATIEKMRAKLEKLTVGFWPQQTTAELVRATTGPVDASVDILTTILRQRS
jgi:2-methylcitrate dehydratase PrpD